METGIGAKTEKEKESRDVQNSNKTEVRQAPIQGQNSSFLFIVLSNDRRPKNIHSSQLL